MLFLRRLKLLQYNCTGGKYFQPIHQETGSPGTLPQENLEQRARREGDESV